MTDNQIFKIENELHELLQFWIERTIDEENGGFYGRIDGYNNLHPKADKGVILNTRILWTFSAAARQTKSVEYRNIAARAYDYLLQYFWDEKESGVFWMLNCEGKVVESKKQIYAQAFAMYALSEYYLLMGEETALEKALQLFELIEKYSFDPLQNGYFEAFSRDWQALEDLRLSEKDANEAKTMNTHLHVLEAYTTLLKASKNERVRQSLQKLIQLFLDTFIDKNSYHLHLFFDENWQLKSDEISFGHDIEASWLLIEAAKAVGGEELLKEIKTIALKIVEITVKEGFDSDGALFNEANSHGLTDTDKHWWPQAEAIVGLLYAYRISSNDVFLRQAVDCWGFVKSYLKDKKNGEWYFRVNREGMPYLEENKVGPWKAPYHHGRMCMVVLGLEGV